MMNRPSDALLRGLCLFADLDASTLDDLLSRADFVFRAAGETLFDVDEQGTELYVLVTGRLAAVTRTDKGEDSFVGEIVAGETVGEMAAITGEPRAARVIAIRDSWLLKLENSDVQQLFIAHPSFLLKLSRLVVNRLQQTLQNESPEAPVRTLTLVNLHEGLDVRRFLDLFASTFRRIGATAIVDPAIVNGVPPERYADRLADWMEEQEATAQYLLLPTGVGDSTWDEACVGQADRVVLLTSDEDLEEQDFRNHPLWQRITANRFRKIETIVFHLDKQKRAIPTGKFLQRHKLRDCYHLRAGMKADYSRVARTITGNAVGLVLGGGGARGFAHVGAIRALQERGIGIDHVCGTSIGAFIGAELASGMSLDEMQALNRQMFVDSNPTNDYRFPRVALLAGRKVDRRLKKVFGELAVEDMWLPYFCVSANLSEAAVRVHDRGRVWTSIRASLSIPGVFPPVIENNDLLVDGGIVNNLPVLLARQRRPGRIVAVDVSGNSKLQPIPGREQSNAAHAHSGGEKPPGILDILIATGTFGNEVSRGAAITGTDLLVRPKLDQFHLLDWKPMEEIEELGYLETCKMLDASELSADG